jgi:hypothetical protein
MGAISKSSTASAAAEAAPRRRGLRRVFPARADDRVEELPVLKHLGPDAVLRTRGRGGKPLNALGRPARK